MHWSLAALFGLVSAFASHGPARSAPAAAPLLIDPDSDIVIGFVGTNLAGEVVQAGQPRGALVGVLFIDQDSDVLIGQGTYDTSTHTFVDHRTSVTYSVSWSTSGGVRVASLTAGGASDTWTEQ